MSLDLTREFHDLAAAFEDEGLDYAVVGALAVAVWGAPRATTDIDILARPQDLDRLLEIAKARGFRLRAFRMTFRDGVQLERVTKVVAGESLTLDILLVNDDLEPIWASRSAIDTEQGPIKVISRDALIQMKAAANRPQDIADIQRLEELDR